MIYNLLITFQLYMEYDSSWDKFVAGYKKDNISANQLYQCWLHTKKISEFVNAYLNYYHPDLSVNDMKKYIENIWFFENKIDPGPLTCPKFFEILYSVGSESENLGKNWFWILLQKHTAMPSVIDQLHETLTNLLNVKHILLNEMTDMSLLDHNNMSKFEEYTLLLKDITQVIDTIHKCMDKIDK